MQNMVKPTPTPVTRLFFTPSFKLSSSASLYLATVSQAVNAPRQGFITPGHSQSPHSTLAIIVSQTVSFPDQGHCTWPQSVKTVNIPHQGHCTVSQNSQHSPSGSLYLAQSMVSTHPTGVTVQSVKMVNTPHQGHCT